MHLADFQRANKLNVIETTEVRLADNDAEGVGIEFGFYPVAF
jgi:hypothetical protein